MTRETMRRRRLQPKAAKVEVVTRDYLDKVTELWAAERVDIDTWPLAIFGRIRRIADLLERGLAPIFVDHGLKGGEFEVLSALRRVGPPYQVSPTELSRSVVVTGGAMTKRIDNLERAGLVERQPNPVDRRAQLIRLTDAGKALIDEVLPTVVECVGTLLQPIEADSEQLIALLRIVLAGLEPEGAAETPNVAAAQAGPAA